MPSTYGKGAPRDHLSRSSSDHLTDREIEVLLLVAAGMRNGLIAEQLGISVRTVDQHITVMRHRASAGNRGELIARCYAAGILRPGVWPPTWTGSRCLGIASEKGAPARSRADG
jgi:DNA-binding CsgD family transcriptional regulator